MTAHDNELLVLGWTPILRGAVRRKAAARLEDFVAGA